MFVVWCFSWGWQFQICASFREVPCVSNKWSAASSNCRGPGRFLGHQWPLWGTWGSLQVFFISGVSSLSTACCLAQPGVGLTPTDTPMDHPDSCPRSPQLLPLSHHHLPAVSASVLLAVVSSLKPGQQSSPPPPSMLPNLPSLGFLLCGGHPSCPPGYMDFSFFVISRH